MCEELIKHIYHISEKYGGDKVVIFTNHLKISGKLCKCEDRDKSDYILTLMNAHIHLLDDLCKCGDENCNCSAAKIYQNEWLNINVDKIVSFTLVKE